MSKFLITAGFVLVALIGLKIFKISRRKKEGAGLDDRLRANAISEPITASSRFTCPYEYIDLTILEHVNWLKSEKDPELWHVATQAALAYTDDPHKFVPWVVEQAELDRSTGGWIFLWSQGSLFLKGGETFYHSFSGDEYILEVLSKLTNRSETIGFLHDKIGLDNEWEEERQHCLRLVENGENVSVRRVPHNLLDKPYLPSRAIIGIDNEEGLVWL